ncbi:MAG: hypothetical protein PHE43_02515 [Candidatus Nanoarchaeia archaeon]|nr:hypothetical protein [Candidatus Nanoarchaeia archaeon]
MAKEEQVGFHKGSLATLIKERQEMTRIITIVDQLIQMHIKALKDLGIDIEKEVKETEALIKKTHEPKREDEDLADKLF